MAQDILGIHHVTAIASDPQKNIDFYTQVLGLRLVKLTVNFDDPTPVITATLDMYGCLRNTVLLQYNNIVTKL